ncbi:MAG: response regulator [Myxococcales bacterium]|nr:response regulator [Myxococcales bacterium]
MAQKVPIGKLLIQKKTIDQAQLGQALERQRQSGGKLASSLLELGLAAEEDLLLALGEQMGLPAVDLSQTVLPLSALDLIPEAVALQSRILPLRVEPDRVLLAMANPEDRQVMDEVAFICGRKVEPYVVLEARLAAVTREAFSLHKRDPSAKFFRGERAAPPSDREDPAGYLAIVSQALPEPDVHIESDEELISIEVATSEEELRAAAEKPPSQPADDRPLVLVVDDEEDIVRMLEKALTAEGFRVVSAARGLEALQAVKAHRPRLVLLDAMLPEIHGFEICRKIKSSQRFGKTPVVMISAVYKGWRYAQDVMETYGADDFFEKPFRLIPLVKRVKELLNAGQPPVESQAADNQAVDEAYRKGVSLYRQKQYNEAEAELRRACSLDPFVANIHYALANVLLAKNQVYEAIREYEQTIELKPNLFTPLRNLAILYQKKGFKNKAVEMWERALRCSPSEAVRNQVKEQLIKLL